MQKGIPGRQGRTLNEPKENLSLQSFALSNPQCLTAAKAPPILCNPPITTGSGIMHRYIPLPR